MYEVQHLGQAKKFTATQITAMVLKKLKEDAIASLGGKISECVIAVPSYFTTLGESSMKMAANIAGLTECTVIKDSTAIATDYGFFRDFTEPKIVMFIDIGFSATQIFICRFFKNKWEIICEKSTQFGGQEVNEKLAKHFLAEFNFSKDDDKTLWLRLLDEVDDLKKKMSLDTIKFPLIVENSQGKMLKASMSREEMESICSKEFAKIERTIKSCIDAAELQICHVHTVELVGGSSRIPKIGEIVEKMFGKAASSTMNRDEAIAQGCAKKVLLKTKKNLETSVIKFRIPDGAKGEVSTEKLDELRKIEVYKIFSQKLELNILFQEELTKANKLEHERQITRNDLEAFITKSIRQLKLVALKDEKFFKLIDNLESQKNQENLTTEEYREIHSKLEEQLKVR